MLGYAKAESDDSLPYWDFSMGAKRETNMRKPGTFFKALRLAGATDSPLCTVLGFTLDMACIGIMHCVDSGVTHEV